MIFLYFVLYLLRRRDHDLSILNSFSTGQLVLIFFLSLPLSLIDYRPCTNCNLFTSKLEIDNEIESNVLGETCIDAITEHCRYFYVEDRNACRSYIDQILEAKYPDTDGECRFKTLSAAALDAFTKGV